MNIIPEAVKIRKRSFSFVWITPVIALFITVWIIYSGFINSGKEIIVQFDSGANIVEGKTPVKYKGVIVGKVKRFEFTEAIDKINVVIKLRREAQDAAIEGMMFWIVKPRLGWDRITGLETILTGTYIEMRPPSYDIKELMKRKKQDFFIALSEPPIEKFLDGGIFINLVSKKDPGVHRGMALYHNGVEAGQIISVKYDEKANFYRITVAIDRKFEKYVNSMTRFWNVSKFDLKYDTAGFHFRFDAINAIFEGGIAFNSPVNRTGDTKKIYRLYRNHKETLLSEKKIIVHMPESFGVKGGRTPVIFKGIPVGLVTELKLSSDKKEVLATVQMNKEYEYLVRKTSRFVIGKPTVSTSGVKNLSSIISGVFLGIEAGEGEFATEFYISEESPVEIPKGSIEFTLIAEEKGAVKRGTGIYYKGVKIGVVKAVELKENKVHFSGVIYPEYKNLATTSLYLWETASVGLRVDSGGIGLRTSGLSKLLGGGISAGFFTTEKGNSIKNGHIKKLFNSYGKAKEAFIASNGIRKISLVTNDATGIYNGAPVVYRGIKIGEIENYELDKDKGTINLSAMISRKYSSLVNNRTFFWKLGVTSIKIGTDGVNIKAPGVKEMFKGGITFEHSKVKVHKGNKYYLYSDRSSAESAVKMASFGKKVKLFYSGTNPPIEGALVFYRGVRVGETGKTGYDKKERKPYISVYINSDFVNTLKPSTRFFRGSQIKAEINGAGVKTKVEPVLGYIKGSIHYDTFIKEKGVNELYEDRLSAERPDCKSAVVKLWVGHNLKKHAPVLSKGREIGFIESIDYENEKPLAKILIRHKFTDYLKEGALFWTRNMVVSVNGLKNADSMFLGSKMIMLPGTGKTKTVFTASEEPLSESINAKGLHIILKAESRNSLEIGSPVYFRQMQTGIIEWIKLSKDGKSVKIGVYIKEKYAHFVSKNSVFSSATGIRATFGFFNGLNMKTESLKSVIQGGVSFETKDMKAEKASNGDIFELKI